MKADLSMSFLVQQLSFGLAAVGISVGNSSKLAKNWSACLNGSLAFENLLARPIREQGELVTIFRRGSTFRKAV
ncbi:hypothetical protein C2U69_34710 [Cupriavidus pinatubonensis]|nr:hypothetical protein C2U69_34710 [Cupriavidus pinatubonensis]